jgi:hypothetical protein
VQDLLKYVDVLIGLSLVMLLASTVIAAVTQIFTTGTFARARFLRRGVAKLIRQLDPELAKPVDAGAAIADHLADAVLRHPMIGHEGSKVANTAAQMLMGAINRNTQDVIPGTVIEREELVRVLLEIAANEGPLSGDQVDEKVRIALRTALGNNGIANPAATLKEIRARRVELELQQPQLSQAVWHAQAVMEAAACDFVGKVNSWFDNTMDRVTQRFASEARTVTTILALGFVIAIQLDVRDLTGRLWADDSLRKELVQEAQNYQNRVDAARSKAASAPTPAEHSVLKSQADEDQERWNAVRQSLDDMRTPGLQLIPEHLVWEGVARTEVAAASLAGAATHFRLVVDQLVYPLQEASPGAAPLAHLAAGIKRVQAPVRVAEADNARLRLVATSQNVNSIRVEIEKAPGIWLPVSGEVTRAFDMTVITNHFWGVLFAWILVSLGAPFWYDALKNLLKFRSVVAQKEEKHRDDRNTTRIESKTEEPARSASAVAAGDTKRSV